MNRACVRIVTLLLAAAAACLPCGCKSGSAGPGRVREEVAELRAARAREMSEMTGKPVAPPVTARQAEPPPAVLPEKREKVPESVKQKRPEPEWTGTGRSSLYDASRYIIGVGSCRKAKGRDYESLTVAEDRARDAVAKNIRVRIQSEYRSAAKLVTEMRTGKTEVEQDTTSLVNEITSSADLVLEGVQIADRWHDAKEDAYWVLAVMDRRMAGANILDRINHLRREIARDHELARTFRQAGSAFQALSHYNRSRRSSLGIVSYRSQLRIIAPAMAQRLGPLQSDANLAALWREAALAGKELRVGVLVFLETGGYNRVSARHNAALSGALRRLDLNVVKLPPPPRGSDYNTLRNRSIRELRAWVGGRANCLLLAVLGSQYVNSAILGRTTIHFYQGRGQAVAYDLAEGSVVAEAAFEYSPATHTGNKNRRQAEEGAISKAAYELGKALERELAAALMSGE